MMSGVNRFQRSFRLLSESLAIVRADRSLLVFPVLSAFFTVVAAVLILLPTAAMTVMAENNGRSHAGAPIMLGLLLAGYASTAVATYFNVALISCAAKNFRNERATVGDGLRAANSRIGAILLWALIASLVGTILRAVEQRAGLIGSIVASLLGAAWAVATYFVVPVLAFERVGPGEAIKRSVEDVRRSWGESLIGNVGLGFAGALVAVPIFLLGFVGADLVRTHTGAGVIVLVVAGGLLLAWLVVCSALSQVFKTAVYLYASTGEVVGYSPELVEGAFREKRSLRRRFFG
jgi:Family of unknown function (DUF6159)